MASVFHYQVAIKGNPVFFDWILAQTGVTNFAMLGGTLATQVIFNRSPALYYAFSPASSLLCTG